MGYLAVLSLSFCVRQCVGALQVTTNITGSEIDFKERLLIEWSGDSQTSHDVGVQQQSTSENGSFVLLSGRFEEGEEPLWLYAYVPGTQVLTSEFPQVVTQIAL